MPWTRPSSVPFPSVWLRFQAKGLDSPDPVWYVVQDVPEDRFEDTVRFMSRFFPHDEQLNEVLGFVDDPLALEESVHLWRDMVRQRVSLVCFREGSSEIVGANMLGVSCKADQKREERFGSAILQTIYDTTKYVSKQANLYERYGVQEYLSAMGLSVDPKYRGRGIATELLRARIPLCRAVGIRLTSTCFTGAGSQIAAARAGYTEDYSVTYGELKAIDARFDFPGIENKPCKYMSYRIE